MLFRSAPACYITTLPRVARAIGPQDAEQNIFGQLKFGMDHPDYLTMRAPSPALVAAAIQDFFPIAGARAAVEEARGMYAILGKPDQIAKVLFFVSIKDYATSAGDLSAMLEGTSRGTEGVAELDMIGALVRSAGYTADRIKKIGRAHV